MTTEDIKFHGVDIPKGSVINVRYAAANLDDAMFETPQKLDLERENSRQHLAFGRTTTVWVPSRPKKYY